MTRRVLVSPMSSVVVPSGPAVLEQAPPSSALPPVSVAVREVLGLPALLLCQLPLPTALLCRTHEGERIALGSSSAAPVVADALAFVGPELSALVIAAEHERANRVALSGWCARKAADARWRLTSLEALGGLGFAPPPRAWIWERVLWALGLRLEEVRA